MNTVYHIDGKEVSRKQYNLWVTAYYWVRDQIQKGNAHHVEYACEMARQAGCDPAILPYVWTRLEDYNKAKGIRAA